jgi:hypothetical protein
VKYLLVACLACSAFGCASDNPPTGTPAASSSRGDGSYRTGSRLPSYDPPGTAASREISSDDWQDGRRNQGNLPVYR